MPYLANKERRNEMRKQKDEMGVLFRGWLVIIGSGRVAMILAVGLILIAMVGVVAYAGADTITMTFVTLMAWYFYRLSMRVIRSKD